MKYLFLLIAGLLIITSPGCKKRSAPWKNQCVTMKYVGQGCYPVIQIITNIDHKLEDWPYGDTIYHHCINLGNIPDIYKNGLPFSGTLIDISDDKGARNAMCLSPIQMLFAGNFASVACVLPD